jgi:hypothetical protein
MQSSPGRSDVRAASNRHCISKPLHRRIAAVLVAVSCLACATTRTWTPLADQPESREIASSVVGKTATLRLTPGAKSAAESERRTQTQPVVAVKNGLETETLEMEVKELDFVAIHGDTAGSPRSIALSEVGSISYVNNRGATAALGALLGGASAAALGYVIISNGTSGCSGDSAYACPLVTAAAAGVGALIGGIVGTLIGQRVTLLLQPVPTRKNASVDAPGK